jgi:hypothetical protein
MTCDVSSHITHCICKNGRQYYHLLYACVVSGNNFMLQGSYEYLGIIFESNPRAHALSTNIVAILPR